MFNFKAFITGMWEFRKEFTTHYNNWDKMCSYDWGRDIAHRVTFNRYSK